MDDTKWQPEPVLDAQALIDRTGLGNALLVLRIKLAFPAEVFALAVRPLIDGWAEFVQLLPVTGSPVFDHPGGQLQRAVTAALRALDRRRTQILPRGAAPEVIGAQAHRWTYAVFVAALLRDAACVLDGLWVWLPGGADSPRLWDPARGSMRSCGALTYLCAALPPGQTAARIDPALGEQLFHQLVPPAVQHWLAEDVALRTELSACLVHRPGDFLGDLSGDCSGACSDQGGIIKQLLALDAPAPRPPVAPAPGPGHDLDPVAPRPAMTGPVTNGATLDAVVEVVPAVAEVPDRSVVQAPLVLAGPACASSALARQFMAWLDQGLRGGGLAVNSPQAFVHRVAAGLLLVAPQIFREFARQEGLGKGPVADVVRRVQREVLRQRWHQLAVQGGNILCFEQRRRDGSIALIKGVLIRLPQQHLGVLPAIDPTLLRSDPAPGPVP